MAGWLAYCAMVLSGGTALTLAVVHVRTGTLPGKDWPLLRVSLLVFAISLPATLVARRRARSRLALVQSNNRWNGP